MDETKMTAAEMLAQVNTAITTVLCGGQSYKIGSRSLTRADLAMLKSCGTTWRHSWPMRKAAACWAGLMWHFLTGGDRHGLA